LAVLLFQSRQRQNVVTILL